MHFGFGEPTQGLISLLQIKLRFSSSAVFSVFFFLSCLRTQLRVCRLFGDGYTSELVYRSIETCILEFSPLRNGLSQNCRTAGQKEIKTIHGVENILYSWLLSLFYVAPDSTINGIEILLAY